MATALPEDSVAGSDGANSAGIVRPRLDSVDLLRGLVMVLMVLDHTRDFLANSAISTTNPTNLAQTTPALFFTRWVTHFCAPVFIFLAGTGAFLSGARGKSKPELAGFLLTRGLWIVLLGLTAERFGLMFSLDFQFILLAILWAIGWSMVVLAGLVLLPTRVVGAIGIAMILTHNLADGVDPQVFGRWAPLWTILHQQAPLRVSEGVTMLVAYPLVPWPGVMAAGYAFGSVFLLKPERRRRVLWQLGGALTLAFVAVRALNVYGDPQPWSVQATPLFTVMSFLNCTKYPPSLQFLLMTLGPAIMALAVFDRGIGPLGRPLVTLGRVPMFYYLLQWPVIHLLAVAAASARGLPVGVYFGRLPFGYPPGYGFALPGVYLGWLLAVALMFPLCVWFARYKRHRRDRWLSYL